MRFIAVMRSAESAGFPPPQLMAAIGDLGSEARKAGVLVDTGGLLPVATATRVTVTDGRIAVADGSSDDKPMGAYAIYDVAGREEALDWVTQFMDLHRKHWPGWEGESELRQLFGPEGATPS